MSLSDYKDAAEAVGKYLPETTKELDCLGSTVVGAINLALSPFFYAKEYMNFLKGEFKERLEQKKNSIPKERQTEIPKCLAYPVIDRLKYSFDEEYLKNMYMNLLSSSMDKDNLSSIHPSFYSIIESLSHLDAKVFSFLFNDNNNVLSATIRIMIKKTDSYYIEAFPKYYIIELLDNIEVDPFLISSSINNLYRLGLLNINLCIIRNPKQENKFSNHKLTIERFNSYKEMNNNINLKFGDYYYIQISDFGRIFGKICIL